MDLCHLQNHEVIAAKLNKVTNLVKYFGKQCQRLNNQNANGPWGIVGVGQCNVTLESFAETCTKI